MIKKETYLNWVLKQIYFDQIPGSKRYKKLMRQLLYTPFKWVLPEDEQRALDGLILRKEAGMEYAFLEECSVLEMLVEFALRIETEWIGNPRNFRPDIIFWAMIEHLGLNLAPDDNYNESFINHSLEMWMSRSYSSDGFGGLFPMKYTTRDQRVISLWDQMLEYITVNDLC